MKRWWLRSPSDAAGGKTQRCPREDRQRASTAWKPPAISALTVSGVRQGYRMKKDPGDLRALTERYVEVFQKREHADLDRLRQVLGHFVASRMPHRLSHETFRRDPAGALRPLRPLPRRSREDHQTPDAPQTPATPNGRR